MTTYLLDTNALIYLAVTPEVVPRSMFETLADERNGLIASVVSIYEVGNKHRLGKLPLSPDDLLFAAKRFATSFLPLSAEVCAAASILDWSHRDPWDRLIAAQAIAEGAALVSSDRAFDALAGLERVW